MTTTLVDQYYFARKAGVPVVAICTADQQATMARLVEGNAELAEAPQARWDIVRGVGPLNKPGKRALEGAEITPSATVGFVEALIAAPLLPRLSVLFALNAHRQLVSQEPAAIAAAVQAVANLRDLFKADHRMLVLLGPDFTLPPELQRDVVVLEDPLPGHAELEPVVTRLVEAGRQSAEAQGLEPLPVPDAPTLARAVEAIGGLSLFEAEQVTAMSLGADGLDVDAMWSRKVVAIEQARGLTVYRGRERFADIIGNDSVKARLQSRIGARTPVGVVVVIDEGADVFQGGDTNSNKTDQQRQLLTEMEFNEWTGIIACGVPGTGKTLLGRAFGNEAGVPTMLIDFGAMESKWVGESEAFVRDSMRTIKAMGNGHAYFILTCNSLRGIRPQFQRRFTDGVFFFDLLTRDQQAAMWRYYLAKYGLPDQPLPPHDLWTGAEIRNCCRDAWNTRRTLLEAARFVMPTAVARRAEVEEMRKEASGRFLSADDPGLYEYRARGAETDPGATPVRAISVPFGATPKHLES